MSKTKPESLEPIGPGRVFRDKLYTSRTLVFPDSTTAPVSKGRVTASSDEQFALLSAHPDLELVQE